MILAADSAKFKEDFMGDTPQQLVIRLGEDFNWWIEPTSGDPTTDSLDRGILDPRQVLHLVTTLETYQSFGLAPDRISDAFQLYRLESELDDNRLCLIAASESIHQTGEQLFALPLTGADETDSAYCQFLEALTVAHIRKLNATHHYARNCTELEMFEELDALDQDRYFSADILHAFDEINEILEWTPAEWDNSTS